MAIVEVHKGDVGTRFELTFKDDGVVVDVSSAVGAEDKQVIFEKPSGKTLTKNASFVTDGIDGRIEYATIVGDVDLAGMWKLQGNVKLTNGEWKSSVHEFRVYENL